MYYNHNVIVQLSECSWLYFTIICIFYSYPCLPLGHSQMSILFAVLWAFTNTKNTHERKKYHALKLTLILSWAWKLVGECDIARGLYHVWVIERIFRWTVLELYKMLTDAKSIEGKPELRNKVARMGWLHRRIKVCINNLWLLLLLVNTWSFKECHGYHRCYGNT